MVFKKYNNLKIEIYYIILLLLLSALGSLFEFLAIIDKNFKIDGILGDVFYLYLFLMETLIFSITLIYYFKNSHRFISFYVLGIFIAILGAVLNILTILANFLYQSFINKTYGTNIWQDVSLIILLGILSVPLLIHYQINKFKYYNIKIKPSLPHE